MVPKIQYFLKTAKYVQKILKYLQEQEFTSRSHFGTGDSGSGGF
jgi:hypothetical protein